MKRFLLIFLVALSITTNLSSFAPFELEDIAQQWVTKHATDTKTGKFNLTLDQTELLANALFHSYKLLKLDELTHACNRITVFFHKVLPGNLEEHEVILSPKTIAAFSTLIANGKQDLVEGYATAGQKFEAAVQALEISDNNILIDAYNDVKETAYTSVETWSKEEGKFLSNTALEGLNEEQAKNLFIFALDPQIHQEKVAEMLANIPLKNLEDFLEFQTEAHQFIKSIWETHLIFLIQAAEFAGQTKTKLMNLDKAAESVSATEKV